MCLAGWASAVGSEELLPAPAPIYVACKLAGASTAWFNIELVDGNLCRKGVKVRFFTSVLVSGYLSVDAVFYYFSD